MFSTPVFVHISAIVHFIGGGFLKYLSFSLDTIICKKSPYTFLHKYIFKENIIEIVPTLMSKVFDLILEKCAAWSLTSRLFTFLC